MTAGTYWFELAPYLNPYLERWLLNCFSAQQQITSTHVISMGKHFDKNPELFLNQFIEHAPATVELFNQFKTDNTLVMRKIKYPIESKAYHYVCDPINTFKWFNQTASTITHLSSYRGINTVSNTKSMYPNTDVLIAPIQGPANLSSLITQTFPEPHLPEVRQLFSESTEHFSTNLLNPTAIMAFILYNGYIDINLLTVLNIEIYHYVLGLEIMVPAFENNILQLKHLNLSAAEQCLFNRAMFHFHVGTVNSYEFNINKLPSDFNFNTYLNETKLREFKASQEDDNLKKLLFGFKRFAR